MYVCIHVCLCLCARPWPWCAQPVRLVTSHQSWSVCLLRNYEITPAALQLHTILNGYCATRQSSQHSHTLIHWTISRQTHNIRCCSCRIDVTCSAVMAPLDMPSLSLSLYWIGWLLYSVLFVYVYYTMCMSYVYTVQIQTQTHEQESVHSTFSGSSSLPFISLSLSLWTTLYSATTSTNYRACATATFSLSTCTTLTWELLLLLLLLLLYSLLKLKYRTDWIFLLCGAMHYGA